MPASSVSVLSHHGPRRSPSTAFVGCKSCCCGAVPAITASVPSHYGPRRPASNCGDVVPARAVRVSSHHRPHPPELTAFVGCKSHRRGIVPAPAANVPLQACPHTIAPVCRRQPWLQSVSTLLWCRAFPCTSVPSHQLPFARCQPRL